MWLLIITATVTATADIKIMNKVHCYHYKSKYSATEDCESHHIKQQTEYNMPHPQLFVLRPYARIGLAHYFFVNKYVSYVLPPLVSGIEACFAS